MMQGVAHMGGNNDSETVHLDKKWSEPRIFTSKTPTVYKRTPHITCRKNKVSAKLLEKKISVEPTAGKKPKNPSVLHLKQLGDHWLLRPFQRGCKREGMESHLQSVDSKVSNQRSQPGIT